MTAPTRRGPLAALRRFLTGSNTPRWGQNYGRILNPTDIDISPINNKTEIMERYAGWVYVCSEMIASDIRSQNWRLYRAGNETTNQRVTNFLNTPSPGMTWPDFIEIIDKHLSTAGETYLHINQAAGSTVGLTIIYPHWVTEPHFTDGIFTHWTISIPGRPPQRIPRERIIRIHTPHPLDPFLAASPVVAMAASHYFDLYLRSYGMSTLRNDGGVPTGLLTTDTPLTTDEAENYKEMWRQRYSQQKELAVMGAGLKYQQLGINIKDLRFADAAAFTRDQILAAYRVPPAVYGDMSDANRSNVGGAMETYQRQALRPRLMRYANIVTTQILPLINASNLEFRFDEVVRADRTQDVADAEAGARWGTITMNEFRHYLNLEARPDGNELLPGQMAAHNPNTSNEAPNGLSNPNNPTPEEDQRKARSRELRGLFASWQTKHVAEGGINLAKEIRSTDLLTPAEFMMACELEGLRAPDGIDREFFEKLKGPIAKRISVLQAN